jgi:hypothetical protein
MTTSMTVAMSAARPGVLALSLVSSLTLRDGQRDELQPSL